MIRRFKQDDTVIDSAALGQSLDLLGRHLVRQAQLVDPSRFNGSSIEWWLRQMAELGSAASTSGFGRFDGRAEFISELKKATVHLMLSIAIMEEDIIFQFKNRKTQ